MKTEQGTQILSVGQLLMQISCLDLCRHMLDASCSFYQVRLLLLLPQRPVGQQLVQRRSLNLALHCQCQLGEKINEDHQTSSTHYSDFQMYLLQAWPVWKCPLHKFSVKACVQRPTKE